MLDDLQRMSAVSEWQNAKTSYERVKLIRWKWYAQTRDDNGYFKWYLDGNLHNKFNNVAKIRPITALESLRMPTKSRPVTDIFSSLNNYEQKFVLDNIDRFIAIYSHV